MDGIDGQQNPDNQAATHKSLKINVMRDLKSAQKLKNAYLATTTNPTSTNNTETNHNQTTEASYEDRQEIMRRMGSIYEEVLIFF